MDDKRNEQNAVIERQCIPPFDATNRPVRRMDAHSYPVLQCKEDLHFPQMIPKIFSNSNRLGIFEKERKTQRIPKQTLLS